jgi:23S rRNA (cytosine1962-C5)-methyltransferase
LRGNANEGRWQLQGLPPSWTISHSVGSFELKPTSFGHIGLFVEQAANWDWISARVRRAKRPLKVLNLFAHTGGATFAAASAGAEVVHVDSARNILKWARRNALISGLADAPIRWICEDATKFVGRELKRGNHYDAVILDPPTYGHGPKGEAWKLGDDLPSLLSGCGQLTRERRAFVLLSCHSPAFGLADLQAIVMDRIFGTCEAGVVSVPLFLKCNDGRKLPSGITARWPAV